MSRFRLSVSWTVKLNQLDGPFNDIEEFEAHIRNSLIAPFPRCQPEISGLRRQPLSGDMVRLDFIWTVDPYPEPGPFREINDYQRHARIMLHDGISFFSFGLRVDATQPG